MCSVKYLTIETGFTAVTRIAIRNYYADNDIACMCIL